MSLTDAAAVSASLLLAVAIAFQVATLVTIHTRTTPERNDHADGARPFRFLLRLAVALAVHRRQQG